MQYLALALFAVLCAVGAFRPMWALVLLFVMFAIEVAIQASVDLFRSLPFLANVIVAGVVGMAMLVAVMRQPRPMVGYATPTLACTVAILAWSVVSLIWSPAESLAPNQGANIILEGYPYFLVFVLAAPLLVDTIQDWRRATTIMLVVGSLVALSIVASPDFTIKSGRIGFTFSGADRSSPLAIAQMGGMLAIFGALSAGGRATGLQTTVRVAAIILGALLTLFSGTRGQAVFALAVIALFLPVSRRLRNFGSYISLVGVGAVVALGAMYTFDFVLGQSDTDRWQAGAVADATSIRMSNALDLLSVWVVSLPGWILGLGYNAFSSLGGVGEQGYVHNLYVEVLCELGLPMFVLLVLLFWRTGSASLALFRRYGDRPAERSAVSILLAMCVYQALLAAKEGNLWSSWNLFTFMLLITRIETRARVLGEDQPDVAEDEMTEEAHEEEIEERERVEQPA